MIAHSLGSQELEWTRLSLELQKYYKNFHKYPTDKICSSILDNWFL